MRRTGVLAAVAAAMMMAGCSSGVEGELDQLFSGLFPEGEPGGAVLVVKNGKVLYDRGFGIADMETGAGIDGDTFFNIASCSKQFTAVAVLQLAGRGLLSLDAPLAEYFPEYTDPLWRKVTVAHLLSHSSGIPDGRSGMSYTLQQRIDGDENLSTEFMQTVDHLNFEPGTDYEYLNPTFVLLGRLVERVSGQVFTDYVRENILVPAGMESTLYFDRDHQDLIPSMAHGYEYADVSEMPEERTADAPGGGKKDWYEYDFGEEIFFATRPDGGIYSSTHELLKWEKALQDGSVLSAEWLAKAFTPHTLVSGSKWSDYQNRPGTWYGYGWFMEPDKGCIYHTGDNGGFKALIARYPSSNSLLVILSNRADWDRYAVKTCVEEIISCASGPCSQTK